MKKMILTMAAIAVAASLYADDKVVVPDSTGFTFTDVTLVKTTPVKDQNKSGTCWSFAGTSFMEDEIMRKGGPEMDLSEMFTVRNCYSDKAKKYIRMDGKVNFAQGGGLHDILYVMKNYGMMPEEAYTGLNYGEEKHSHYEMADGLTGYMDGILRNGNKHLSTAWQNGVEGILDAYLGQVPNEFTYNGKKYTPKSFMQMLGLNPDDYIGITSFTHHPFYSTFPMEVADNWLWWQYMNVPMEEMQAIVDNALKNGYSVAWAADVSEGGFPRREKRSRHGRH
jgi:bleomycin hydrolase